MSIRTTLTLEDDVVERLKQTQRERGVPFKDVVNDLLRLALATPSPAPIRRNFKIKTFNMGLIPGLNYDDIEGLIELVEGVDHR